MAQSPYGIRRKWPSEIRAVVSNLKLGVVKSSVALVAHAHRLFVVVREDGDRLRRARVAEDATTVATVMLHNAARERRHIEL